MIVAVVFAVLAACSNAVGTVLQRRAAVAAPDSTARFGLVRQLLRSPLWFGGILGVVFAALFQALALNAGSLAAVQPRSSWPGCAAPADWRVRPAWPPRPRSATR